MVSLGHKFVNRPLNYGYLWLIMVGNDCKLVPLLNDALVGGFKHLDTPLYLGWLVDSLIDILINGVKTNHHFIIMSYIDCLY